MPAMRPGLGRPPRACSMNGDTGRLQPGAAGEGRADQGLLLLWTRPDSYWDVAVAHLPLALITGMALVLPHLVPCEDLPLIKCTFLHLTGYPCPFCGLTRSFWAIAHGEWAFAMRNAPLACTMYGGTALVFAWHAAGLITGLRIRTGLFHFLVSRPGIWLMAAMVFLNWAYRLARGLS